MPRLALPMITAALLCAGLVAIMGYEHAAFGWHFAREEAPGSSPWFWLRGIASAALCALFVWSLVRTDPLTGQPPRAHGRLAVKLVMLAAAACTLLLAANPALYQRLGSEDGIIEWATALFLFGGAALMALRALALSRAPKRAALPLIGTLGFAALLFVMGGEEVSWFQRVIGFATPESVAAGNWQGEFNLHNFHTDITEFALYSSTALFLCVLPLMRDTLGEWRVLRPVAPLIPDRTTAALSAPMLIFTYSHWNIVAVQAASMLALLCLLAWARDARRHGDRANVRLWAALAGLVTVGQILHFLLGPTQVAIYDSSEYRELFMGFALVAYAWRQQRSPLPA